MQRIYHDFDEMISALRSAEEIGLDFTVETEYYEPELFGQPLTFRPLVKGWKIEFSDPEEVSGDA